MAAIVLPGVVLAGFGFRRRRRGTSVYVAFMCALLFLAAVGVTACGSYGGSRMSPPTGPLSISITASAGSVSHATVLTLNVQ